jgi:hypothetical protein
MIFAIDMLFETGAELNAWTTDNIADNTIQFRILVNNSIVWSGDAYNKTDVSNAPGTNTKAMIVDGLNIALEAGDEINVQYTTGSQYNGTTMEISCALHVYVSNA